MCRWDEFLTEEYINVDTLDEGTKNFYGRFEAHYICIYMTMENFNINVSNTNGDDIGTIPGNHIELQFLVSLPTLLNKLQVYDFGSIPVSRSRGYYPGDNDLVYRRGRYKHPLGLPHPYVGGRQYGNQGWWRNICLGDLETSMREQAVNLDLVSLMMSFNSWATSYTVGHTHPLNQIHTCHIGMSPKFGDDYSKAVGKDVSSCSRQIVRGLCHLGVLDRNSNHLGEKASLLHNNVCEQVKCVLRDSCGEYKLRKNVLETEKLEDTLDDNGKEMLKQMTNWANTARGGRNG